MKTERAFTLIELLIVVAIIAILAAIAVPNFLEAQVRAKVSKAEGDMRAIASALETFRIDHGKYPPSWSTGGMWNYIQSAGTYGDPLWSLDNIPEGFPKATLTTPIAYISSPPQDPFMPEFDNVPVPPGTWQYGVDASATAAWILESVGPNASVNSGVHMDLPTAGGGSPTNLGTDTFIQLYKTVGPSETRRLFLVGKGATRYPGAYDATNGTKSAGDIVRMGY